MASARNEKTKNSIESRGSSVDSDASTSPHGEKLPTERVPGIAWLAATHPAPTTQSQRWILGREHWVLADPKSNNHEDPVTGRMATIRVLTSPEKLSTHGSVMWQCQCCLSGNAAPGCQSRCTVLQELSGEGCHWVHDAYEAHDAAAETRVRASSSCSLL